MNSSSRNGMSRRHFMQHAATAATTIPTFQFLNQLQANAADVRKRQKACILMWMGGGPPSIDIWDLKPGSKNGGEFKPIDTKGDLQISEHMPKTAMVMDNLSVVRSMSTREADHTRGGILHAHCLCTQPDRRASELRFGRQLRTRFKAARTGNPLVCFRRRQRAQLGLPSARCIRPSGVSSTGQIQNAQMSGSKGRLSSRLKMLDVVETNFAKSRRGDAPKSHTEVYQKAVNLMTSSQMKAFKVEDEDPKTKEAYGENNFGQGLLMARRLVETGVPFIEVSSGGWDLHNGVFTALKDTKLPELDQGIGALTADLKQRGMLDDVVLVWMGEFGRTPRINANVGRDHWARSWSVMIGGGGLQGGVAVGATDADGTTVVDRSYLPGDIWSTVSHALGISTKIVHTSKRGRPMKIANGGTPIKELIG
uniref:Hypothetical secreted protein n=1 Tax=uncultured planctomycete 3FN TaxID=455066 RepID=A9LGX7_9BACT|nr:hypothetical secreted protein [uncultured planctomycete 3FN]